MFEMFLGHLVGDYLFQNEWMALNKAKNNKIGWLSAFIHCIIYTLSVCTIMWNFNIYWIYIVFLTHFPLDKFRIADLYMTYIKGYGLKQYIDDVNNQKEWEYIKSTTGNQMLKGGFTAYVYILTDNTMHLLLMWIGYKLLFNI